MRMNAIIFIFFIFLLTGCISIPIAWNSEQYFNNKFDGKFTGLDTKLNLNGYYHTINGGPIINTYFLFYNDGTFADFVYIKNSLFHDVDSVVSIDGWGHYYLVGDIIYVQVIDAHGGIIEGGYTKYRVDVVNRRFKIISKDTILEIYYHNIGASNQNWKYLNTFATFHPLKDKPDSNCWLKTKPWAWKDGIIIK